MFGKIKQSQSSQIHKVDDFKKQNDKMIKIKLYY